jgi:ATP/maltotriose-dependent transcriptional regulator MalT/DNA-binding SARP family transcriptional activator
VNQAASIARSIAPSSIELMPRARLFELVRENQDRPAFWIEGPPGSGKTGFIASHLAMTDVENLWYQLESDDGDPATFFHYLKLALSKKYPAAGTKLPLLTPEYLPSITVFARQFFSELFAAFEADFAIVLEHYDELPADSPIHDLLKIAITEMPGNGTLYVISRSEPPRELARLCVNQQIMRIGWEQLKFTDEETQQLALQMGCDAKANELIRLNTQLEGWVAGLVLLLANADQHQALPKKVDLNHSETLINYFANEIMGRLTESEQNNLLMLSFMPSLTPDMVEALTDIKDGEQFLLYLQRLHAFIEMRSSDPLIFQFHRLFRKYLRATAERRFDANKLKEVKGRAALVVAEKGFLEHAAKLLFETENWALLCDLACKNMEAILLQGRGRTVIGWFGRLPEDVFEQYPWFSFWLGKALLPFDPVAARQRFAQAYAAFSANGQSMDGKLLSWCGAVESFYHEWKDFAPLDEWIAEIDFMPNKMPAGIAPETAACVVTNMFVALVYRQPSHPAIAIWEQAVKVLLKSDIDPNQRVNIANNLVLYYTWVADLPKIQVIMDTVKELSASSKVAPLTQIIWHSMEAMYGWLVLDFKLCSDSVNKGLQLASDRGIPIWNFMLHAQGCFGALAAGDVKTANAYLKDMSQSVVSGRYLDAAHYHYLGAWAALLENDIPNAHERIRVALEFTKDAGAPFPRIFAIAGLAQVVFEQGDKQTAYECLHEVKEAGESMNSLHFMHHYYLLSAYFGIREQNTQQALENLNKGMALGRQHGYWNITWWRPSVMAELAGVALENNIETEYVQELIRRQHLVPNQQHFGLEQWPWPLKIYTLGRFIILRNGEPMRSTGKAQAKPLELLKVLVSFGGLDVSENKINDVLWPDSDGDMAHHAFNTTLYRLRKLLGNDKVLIMTGGRVSLNRELCWLDVWSFEKLAQQLDEVMRKQHSSLQSLQAIETSIFSTYQGAFFEVESEQSWIYPRRERERSRFIRLVERLANAYKDVGAIDEAMRVYQQAIELDSLVESFYQNLMTAYHDAGRKAEAKALFEQCQSTFEALVGIQPSSRTLKIYKECMAS